VENILDMAVVMGIPQLLGPGCIAVELRQSHSTDKPPKTNSIYVSFTLNTGHGNACVRVCVRVCVAAFLPPDSSQHYHSLLLLACYR
jgi:hypothetical protein